MPACTPHHSLNHTHVTDAKNNSQFAFSLQMPPQHLGHGLCTKGGKTLHVSFHKRKAADAEATE